MWTSRTVVVVVGVVLAAAIATAPTTVAHYTDTETSFDNPVAATVLDLKLSEVGPATEDSTTDETGADFVDATWADSNQHGGLLVNDPVENTLRIDNSNSAGAADSIGIDVTYVEADDGGTTDNVDDTASTMVLDAFSYGGTSLLGTEITDENGNGDYDVEDLTLGQTASNLSQLSGLTAAGTADLRIIIDDNSGLLGPIGSGDGLDITVTVTARAGGFKDADESKNTTIIYA
jgi:type II secretory pathway pseudopilin PulG